MLKLQDVFPFSCEFVTRLSHALVLSEQSTEFMQLSDSEVRELINFMHPVMCAIQNQEAFVRPISFSSLMQDGAGKWKIWDWGRSSCFFDMLETIGVVSKETEKPVGFGEQRKRWVDCTLLVHVSFNYKRVRKDFKFV